MVRELVSSRGETGAARASSGARVKRAAVKSILVGLSFNESRVEGVE